ncbi:MAG TPA: NADP-dependent oxidoreductase [Steroidobacteraceae bacterium]|nr:NADP-dependent oxidoreductase [Steroidobacteraceae bacterium]
MSEIPMNRRIVLAARPQGAADLSNFRLETAPVRPPVEGEVLLRTLWLSLDPYMRGRMSDAPSYVPPVEIGAVMTGQTVARIERSRHPDWREGEQVLAMSGWQEYEVCAPKALTRLPSDLESPSQALGVLGMPAFTAYMGLREIGRPKAGETLVVAAATGAVGSVVGQIGKLEGCRVVGIAGGAQKCEYARTELGFDECLDHRAPQLAERLAAACPRGIDVYFENVGGAVFRAVLPLLNTHARIPVCGLISLYNERPTEEDGSYAKLMRALLVKRITARGFIIFDFNDRRGEFLAAMRTWLQAGKIKYREDIVQGLESAPQAFLGLLAGRNFGKLVVHVAAGEAAR